MKDIRLIDILKTFSAEELKSFEKFLLSAFVKSRRNIGAVLKYFKKFHPDYDSQYLNKEKIFKALFPDEIYNEKKMVNLIFDLTKAAESFIVHTAVENDEIEFLMFLCKGYYNRKLENQSMRVIESLEKMLKPGFSEANNYYEKIRTLESIKEKVYVNKIDIKNIVRSYEHLYEASALQFIVYYIRMLIDCYPRNFLPKSNIMNSIAKCFDMNKFHRLIMSSGAEHKTLITLHYYIFRTIDKPDNLDYYFLLKEFIYKNLSKFDHDEKYCVLTHLSNYATWKSNSGMDFRKEILDTTMKMLENNAYSSSESDNLHILMYTNILSVGIDLKEKVKFIEDFIEKYVYRLNPEDIIDVKNFSYAQLYFYKKDYENAHKMISAISQLNPIFKIDYRLLLMRIYYEKNYFEQVYSFLDSYKHFLSKDKEISEFHKKGSMNFIKVFSKLLKMKSGNNILSPFILKKEIENQTNIHCKTWMLEKLDELIGNKFKL